MASARVLHGRREDIHVLRFVGDIRYPIAPPVTAFMGRLFDAEEVEGLVVDLNEATSIDSTNLGLIARLAVRMRANNKPRLSIVSDKPDINEVLTSMGLRDVLDIVEQPRVDTRTDDDVVGREAPGRSELAQTMLDAHRALIELNEENRDQFSSVVAMLERDLHDA